MFTFAVVCLLVAGATAIEYNCNSLLLQHAPNETQHESARSFNIRILDADMKDTGRFRPGAKLHVELAGSNYLFDSFILQARIPLGLLPLGTWVATSDEQKTYQCRSAEDTITNSNRNLIRRIKAIWTAPSNVNISEIEFVASFTSDKKFWLAINSLLLTSDRPEPDSNPGAESAKDDKEETSDDDQKDPREYGEKPLSPAEDEADAPNNDDDKTTVSQANGGENPNEPEELEAKERDEANARDRAGEEADQREKAEEREEKSEGADHDPAREEEMAVKYAIEKRKELEEEQRDGEAVDKEEQKEELEHQREIDWEKDEMERQQESEQKEAEKRLQAEIRDKEEYDQIVANRIVPLEENTGNDDEDSKEGVQWKSGGAALGVSFVFASLLALAAALFV